jgi:predicted MPP superfamily phosphohydrolase
MTQLHEQEALAKLIDRIGSSHAGKRLEMQTHYSALLLGGHHIHVHMEEFPAVAWLLKTSLKATGLWPIAVRNSNNYRIVEHSVPLPHLPEAFDGFRILHLSDLHIEGMIDKGQSLQTTLSTLQYDLCVLTGDFRFRTFGSYDKTLRLTENLVKTIHAPFGVTGILGNHDWLEMVPGLEQCGIRMLLNEAQALEKGSEAIWLLGLDDVHYYETGDLDKAIGAAPTDAVRILLVHSPEIIPEAFTAGMDLYLCGHSHGGQICLPGGKPIITHCRCPRSYKAGPWQHESMRGYTSRGVGTSLFPIRLFCQPEIIIHTLHKAPIELETVSTDRHIAFNKKSFLKFTQECPAPSSSLRS